MPPTSSDGSPAIAIQTPNGVVYIDSVTGDIISAVPAPNTGSPYASYPPNFGLAGPSQTAGSPAPTATSTVGGGGPAPDAPFDPKTDVIIDRVLLPDGSIQAHYIRNGVRRVAIIPKSEDEDSRRVSATTAYAQQQQNAREAAALAQRQAEQAQAQSQFLEQFGMDKAKFNIQQQYKEAEDSRQRALTQGNTLLGLGSRPDTLLRYLYALQGQQTPQGLQNTTAALPGYENLIGRTNYGAPAAAPTIRPTVAAPPVPVLSPATASAQSALTAAGRVPRFTTPEGVQIFGKGGEVNEPFLGVGLVTGTPILIGESGPETIVPEGKTVKEVKSASSSTKKARAQSGDVMDTPLVVNAPNMHLGLPTADIFDRPLPGVHAMADGGVIGGFDPNVYQGLSGFGTNGKLRLAPNDPDAPALMAKYPGLYEITSAQNTLPTPGLSFGPTGAFQSYTTPSPAAPVAPLPAFTNPSSAGVATSLTTGTNAGLFNPGASNILGTLGGQFPQVGNLTRQGASLIPSIQALSLATPAERQFYSGFLQDEAGVPPEDVFELARRLNPGAKAGAVRGSRYAA